MSGGSDVRVGVVVVTRYRPDLFERAAASVMRQGFAIQGVVVDNGPDDDTRGVANRLGWRYLTREHNLSFSEANNWAMDTISAERVLLLNNDAMLEDGCLKVQLGHDAAVVGSLIVHPDGSVNHAGVRVPLDLTSPYHLGRGDVTERWAGHCETTQATTFAAAVIRRDAFFEAGGMDVDYWYGYEDVDMCLRIRELGGQIITCRDARVVHEEKTTRGDEFDERNFARFRSAWLDSGRAETVLGRWPELASDEPPPAALAARRRRFLLRRRNQAAG